MGLKVVGTKVMCRNHMHSLTTAFALMAGWQLGSMLAELVGMARLVGEGSSLLAAAGMARYQVLWGKVGLNASACVAVVVEADSLDAVALNGLSRRTTW
jgi:hypothetical protein